MQALPGIEDEVIELKAQLEILQTKIRMLIDKIHIVKEIELALEKEIEVDIPPHQQLQL